MSVSGEDMEIAGSATTALRDPVCRAPAERILKTWSALRIYGPTQHVDVVLSISVENDEELDPQVAYEKRLSLWL